MGGSVRKGAVFLDRDGVLIEDVHLLTTADQMRILPRVIEALNRLKLAGFPLVVISNQTVVARGLASEAEVRALNQHLQQRLIAAGGPQLDGWYFCPHHPQATLLAYRLACECRKPRAGLFLQAAQDHPIELGESFAIGDRITDIVAGARAGCRTILVRTGKHLEPPIETVEPLDTLNEPDHSCDNLEAAAAWILDVQR